MPPGSPEPGGPAGQDHRDDRSFAGARPAAADDEQLWAAVADPSRRRILDLLLVQGEATPTTLATGVPFTRQAVSKHLGVLAQVGLVEAHRIGRETRYVVNSARLEAAATAMGQAAAQWSRRLRAVKLLAETAAHELRSRDPQGESHE